MFSRSSLDARTSKSLCCWRPVARASADKAFYLVTVSRRSHFTPEGRRSFSRYVCRRWADSSMRTQATICFRRRKNGSDAASGMSGNVGFAPKATKLLRRRETSLCAIRVIRCGAEKQRAICAITYALPCDKFMCRWRSRPQHHSRIGVAMRRDRVGRSAVSVTIKVRDTERKGRPRSSLHQQDAGQAGRSV